MKQRQMRRGTMIASLVALSALWALSASTSAWAEEQAGGSTCVETALEGLAYRESMVRSMTGTAEFEYTFSPRNCERGRKEAEEYAKDIKWIGEILPLAPIHRSHLEFAADFGAGWWRCEMTDLSVSGHMLWASTNDPALNRHLPAETFRRISVSDGAKIYDYHFGPKDGWIEAYTGKAGHLSEPLASVRTMITVILPSAFRELSDPRYSVSFQGEEAAEGYNCLKIRIAAADLSSGGRAVTLWTAPELDFAVVREESRIYRPATPAATEPMLLTTRIRTAADFSKLADLLWCPRLSTTAVYKYGQDLPEGEDPWDYTKVIRITSLEMNTPVTRITTPYPFPGGTKVTDLTTGTATVVGEGEGSSNNP